MSNNESTETSVSIENKIESLEYSVEKLINYCENLSDKITSLEHSNNQLMIERSELQTKNDKVRGQVEAMVERLKTMDKTS